MPQFDVLIVGAGHAGAQAAIVLRQAGFEGSIGIVGDEPHLPYERPPLSKDFLSGEKDFERLMIRPESFWAEKQVEFLLGQKVVEVRVEAHEAVLNEGQILTYGKLIWAAGCAARRLTCEGHDLEGVHVMRTREDAEAIIEALPRLAKVVIIGGGYIGLEAAAVLAKAGKSVTLLEAQDRVLARVAGATLSRFYEKEHSDHGVDMRLNSQFDHLIGQNGRVSAVVMASGQELPAEMVLVGIGVTPSTGPLLSAGAAGSNGVDIDEFCRTSLEDIYAIGDCAAHINAFASGNRIRLESVQNAVDQATITAKSIMGTPQAYMATPWFWSNQYDLRLQTAGLCQGHDRALLRGDISSRKFSIIYLKNNKIIAIDAVNSPKDFMFGRKLIERGSSPDPALITDLEISLNDTRLSHLPGH